MRCYLSNERVIEKVHVVLFFECPAQFSRFNEVFIATILTKAGTQCPQAVIQKRIISIDQSDYITYEGVRVHLSIFYVWHASRRPQQDQEYDAHCAHC